MDHEWTTAPIFEPLVPTTLPAIAPCSTSLEVALTTQNSSPKGEIPKGGTLPLAILWGRDPTSEPPTAS
jgi:hypothetical protein